MLASVSSQHSPGLDVQVQLKIVIQLLGLAGLLRNNLVELRDEGPKERHRSEEQEDAEDL